MNSGPYTMRIKALAPWFGGKRNLAPLIVRELGEHRAYWEPFCGSMAVLLAKPPCAMETVNDLDRDLINLASVVRDPALGPRLYRRLRRTLMCEPFFEEADEFQRATEGEWHDGMELEAAYLYFLCSWLGRNGTAGTPASHKGTYCARYTAKGGHGGTRWGSVVGSIPAWRRRLGHVTILCRDGFELLERIEDAAGTAIYVDPPYIRKGARYKHDDDARPQSVPDAEWAEAVREAAGNERLAWHCCLARRIRRFRAARVVVSYYAEPELAGLYPRWTAVPVEVNKAMSHGGRRGTSQVTATEVLLINGPSLTRPGDGLFAGELPADAGPAPDAEAES